MKNTNDVKDKVLTAEQSEVVKEMIINSMKEVYTSAGALPGDGFYHAAGLIADKIIKNTQMALIQSNTFKAVAEKGVAPKKKALSKSQARRIKITKNGRK